MTVHRDIEELRQENRRLKTRLEAVLKDRAGSLSRAEERYRNIFEHSGDAIFCIALDGVVMDWNDAATEIFGYEPREVIGRSLDMLWAEGERRRPSSLLEAIGRGETLVNREIWCRRKDGARRCVAVTCAPVLGEDGAGVGGSAIARDVTANWERQDRLEHRKDDLEVQVAERTRELEEANEQLSRQAEMRSLFIASMSHELRTPLNSILGFSDLLRSGMSGALSDEQLKQVEIVHSAGQHLLAVINDIIDLSRIEAGQLVLSPSEFDLGRLVDESVVMASARMNAERVSLTVRTEQIRVRSDERRVKQIVLNLVSNAVKYTQEGTIEVEAGGKGGDMVVSVQDTGCGIAQDDMIRLFKPFQRAGGRGRRPGAGLGLFLSRQLAELLGGDITVESTPGVGSRFTLMLPRDMALPEP